MIVDFGFLIWEEGRCVTSTIKIHQSKEILDNLRSA
jgi:hypothetical protein